MEFYRGWSDAPLPILPSADLRGEIPARALKFCEPFLAANSAGVLVRPPIDFTLTWDGHHILAELEGVEDTLLVDRLFLPDYVDYWTDKAPADAGNIVPPFLEAFPERGTVQVWSGLFVRTRPGISTWIRGPINWAGSTAWSVVEGIVETDWWAGPLFFVLQIQKSDFPVSFYRHTPFLQVVPIDRSLLSTDQTTIMAPPVVEASTDFWGAMVETGARRNSAPAGSYRRESRKRHRLTKSAKNP